MSATAGSPGERTRPANNAFTAALPALRCNASTVRGPLGPRPLPAFRAASAEAVSRGVAAGSGVFRAPPTERGSPSRPIRDTTT
jgi:hypothetical protein